MKYKVGEKVRVVSSLPKTAGGRGGFYWVPEMNRDFDRIFTITETNVYGRQEEYKVLESIYGWLGEWFQPLSVFHQLDTVKVKHTGQTFVVGENNLYRDEDLELVSRKQLI